MFVVAMLLTACGTATRPIVNRAQYEKTVMQNCGNRFVQEQGNLTPIGHIAERLVINRDRQVPLPRDPRWQGVHQTAYMHTNRCSVRQVHREICRAWWNSTGRYYQRYRSASANYCKELLFPTAISGLVR